MRLQRLHIAFLFTLLLAGCDRSGGDQAAGSNRPVGGTPADAVLAEAKATAAALSKQAGETLEPTAGSVETTSAGGPKRRDGWWEMTSGGAVTDTQHLCVGAGSEEGWSLYDQILFSVGDCTKKSLDRQGGGWRFDLDCDSSGTKIKMQGQISGDFRNSFRVEQSGTVDGAPRSANIRGSHLGTCPAPFKPGDVVSGGRVLFNQAKK